ncbi:MAG: NADH-quinone oxidoreductase subunit C [Proteobacteria bacterium]|nr:NADH-quinone oxidoreductase subunit C [Pseudomonadota bacterium]
MSRLKKLKKSVKACLGDLRLDSKLAFDELTVEVAPENIKAALTALRDFEDTRFDQLIDLCGVDYSEYTAHLEWDWDKPRYAVVYNLQSVALNWRMRVKTFLDGEPPLLDSVIDVWPAANWFEREAFDVMGIAFAGHPDLRRILTDYGFIGHPFRKDFPLSGHVEMRYDEEKRRVVYEPVTVEPRILVPRINREIAKQGE